MKQLLISIIIAVPCFLPALVRFFRANTGEPMGLLSDIATGLVIFSLAINAPKVIRGLLLLFWVLFQAASMELLATMQRFPNLKDLQFMLDPGFLEKSAAGLHLSHPLFTGLSFGFALVVLFLPRTSARLVPPALCLVFAITMLGLHQYIDRKGALQDITERYNPLHRLVIDAYAKPVSGSGFQLADLPKSLRESDLKGKKILTKGKARNVLIVTLEGISGIYLPEMREKVGVTSDIFQMEQFAGAIQDSMLIPDFVTHSHQTIRGLYALHCGDISKLSYDTPKAMELLANSEYGELCLPAQLREHGWQTHYLQGAGLQFMNKEKAMPAMGFDDVHGVEWFSKGKKTDFLWGAGDEDFFRGAREYVRNLMEQEQPWLLSLLTVGTHQPFDATEEEAKRYGSRKIASVATLDGAVAKFLNGIREDGVLENTLVIITSDESHGAEGAGWYSSWGIGIVMGPDVAALPRFKQGTYGLVDIEASILDYLSLPLPQGILGRSIFRDYTSGRDMISYTSSKLRVQTDKNALIECTRDGQCLEMENQKLVGPRNGTGTPANDKASKLFGYASALDNKLTRGTTRQVLKFANGEVRPMPEKIQNEWTDNLVGAQYLSFPKKSTVHVDIKLKTMEAGPEGVQMTLTLRQFEKKVASINHPQCKKMKAGEECRIRFSFTNPEARQAFSFHLTGEGKDAQVRFDTFTVTVEEHDE